MKNDEDNSLSLEYSKLKDHMSALENHNVEEVFEEFAIAADDEGLLSEEAFQNCFRSIVERNGGHNDADAHRANIVVHRLFNIFDVDHSGAVDFSER